MNFRPVLTASAALALLACESTSPDVARLVEPGRIHTHAALPGEENGTCYTEAGPGETVAERVLTAPGEIAAAVNATLTPARLAEAAPPETRWFETPCAGAFTPEFVASLQRALKARGHYRGPVNGELDAWTRFAVRSFQRPQGLDSGILSMTAARQLGLARYEPQPLGTEPVATVAPSAANTQPKAVDPAVLWQGAPPPQPAPSTAQPQASIPAKPVDPSILWQSAPPADG